MIRTQNHSGASTTISSALVGRDEQLALALRRWESALKGAGHLLLLAGEAGIGKTRLLAEIANHVGEGARVVTAAAFPRDGDTAGGVLLNLSDELRRGGDADMARALRDRILNSGPSQGDPTHRRRVLVGDLADLVARLITEVPTLFLVEDLHWADELSLDVFERLPEALRAASSMVVMTYRSDELYPQTVLRQWRARLLERRLAEEVRLTRLDLDDTARMSEGITGVVAAATWIESLHGRSDGIPLHVEELIAGGSQNGVPETVAEAVVTRAGLLSAETRSVVAVAAVIGRSFDIDLLASITSSSPASIDAALRELMARHFIRARSDGSNFDFRHTLIREAIYDDIPPNRKRELHGSVARAAIAAGFRDAYVSDHFERAHEYADAYRHSMAAAVDARRMSAHREASELYARALRTETADIPNSERAWTRTTLGLELAAIDDNDGAEAQWMSAIELFRAAGDEQTIASLTTNLMAVRHLLGADLESRTRLGREALARMDALPGGGDRLVRADVLGAIAAAYMLDRRLDDAVEFGEQAAALATGPDGLCERLNIELTLGSVLTFAGRGDEGWARLERAIETGAAASMEVETARAYRMIGTSASVQLDYDRSERWISEGLEYTARTERWNDHYYLMAHLSHVNWATGDWQGAQIVARKSLANGRGITTRITALIVLGYVALGQGNVVEARTHLDEALELAEGMGELQRISPALWGLVELALLQKDTAVAVELSERGFAESEARADAAHLFPFVVSGVRAYLGTRNVGAAHDWLERCERLIVNRSIPGTLVALDHARGLIHLAEGQTGKARELLERASDGWFDRRRFWESAHTLIDLAHCAVRSKRPSEALRLAHHARELATGAGASTIIALADTIIVDTDSIIGDGLLSSREFEVAKLIALGETNKEIALDLTISPKTVSAHVEHILTKLGAARRSEIAAWVARMI
ncbi:MAG: Fimbriae protein [Glaciihabitans sp.]|nr:Fimbriae protein [Glaciihabitans sp.]